MYGSLLEKEARAQTVQLRQQLHSEGIFNLLVEKHEGGFWVMKMSYILIWVLGIQMYSFVKFRYAVHSRFV